MLNPDPFSRLSCSNHKIM